MTPAAMCITVIFAAVVSAALTPPRQATQAAEKNSQCEESPPLTEQQRERLACARDSGDYRQEAFAALIENARSWPAGAGKHASLPLPPDFRVILADPAHYRGRLCRITGTLAQRTTLAEPYRDVQEWFVRCDSTAGTFQQDAQTHQTTERHGSVESGSGGGAAAVYVIMPDGEKPPRLGEHVTLNVRFYKIIDATARDGTPRRYLAFVGAQSMQSSSSWQVHPVRAAISVGNAAAIGATFLLVAFIVALALARRARSPTKRPAGFARPYQKYEAMSSDHQSIADFPLPSDPAHALAELARRAHSAQHPQR